MYSCACVWHGGETRTVVSMVTGYMLVSSCHNALLWLLLVLNNAMMTTWSIGGFVLIFLFKMVSLTTALAKPVKHVIHYSILFLS